MKLAFGWQSQFSMDHQYMESPGDQHINKNKSTYTFDCLSYYFGYPSKVEIVSLGKHKNDIYFYAQYQMLIDGG